MEKEAALQKLRQIGEHGKLEVILYDGVIIMPGDDGFDCTDGGTAGRQGDSLVGRLIEVDNGEDHFMIDNGTGGSEINVHYAHVHSIYPLVRRKHPTEWSPHTD